MQQVPIDKGYVLFKKKKKTTNNIKNKTAVGHALFRVINYYGSHTGRIQNRSACNCLVVVNFT